MSTTVTYKGSVLTTVNNQTRVMKTAGKYMEDDVTLVDITHVPVLQSKTVTITPTTSSQSQTVTPDSGNDGLSQVTINTNAVPTGSEGTPIATKGSVSNHSVTITPSVVNSQGYIPGGTRTGNSVTVSASELVSGSETKAQNGVYDVTNLAELVVNVPSSTGKNVQAYLGYDDVASSSYVATDVSVTVAKTGTYQVSWVGWRTTTSGTSGSRLYVNGVATGNAMTTFTGTYGQSVVRTNVSLEEGDVLVVRARSRNTSYRMYVANLIIEEE